MSVLVWPRGRRSSLSVYQPWIRAAVILNPTREKSMLPSLWKKRIGVVSLRNANWSSFRCLFLCVSRNRPLRFVPLTHIRLVLRLVRLDFDLFRRDSVNITMCWCFVIWLRTICTTPRCCCSCAPLLMFSTHSHCPSLFSYFDVFHPQSCRKIPLETSHNEREERSEVNLGAWPGSLAEEL